MRVVYANKSRFVFIKNPIHRAWFSIIWNIHEWIPNYNTSRCYLSLTCRYHLLGTDRVAKNYAHFTNMHHWLLWIWLCYAKCVSMCKRLSLRNECEIPPTIWLCVNLEIQLAHTHAEILVTENLILCFAHSNTLTHNIMYVLTAFRPLPPWLRTCECVAKKICVSTISRQIGIPYTYVYLYI